MLSRRTFLLGAGALALEASCSSALPESVCCHTPASACPAPDPVPSSLPAERCEIFSFSEIHRATPTIYRPRSECELAGLMQSIPAGRKVTFRGGGQSIDSQSLNDDLVIALDNANFKSIGTPERDDAGFYVTTGAGARWWDVLAKLCPLGLVPPSLVTAGNATVGGTLSADCVSRMSPITGKEGQQVRSFRIVLADGRGLHCKRNDPDPERRTLFNAVVGGFGYLGAVTEVTFDLMVARSNPGEKGLTPRVLTRSTRHGPNVDWDSVLSALHQKSRLGRARFQGAKRAHHGGLRAITAADPRPLARTPEWSALSVASFLMGNSMSANLLEQRFVEDQELRPVPGGIYDKDAAFPSNAEKLIPTLPTLVELAVDIGFPEGEFVDELFGWAFFLGNSTKRAKEEFHAVGKRLNFTQQTFALPSGPEDRAPDTRPTRRFIELLAARLHAADVRPADIDFLYVPADTFLMSASRGLPGFVVTVSFTTADQTAVRPR